MKGIGSYMGWSDIPDLDSADTASDDNPFSGPKAATPEKMSVQMPTEDWLCKKIAKLNLTLVEGYPSRSSKAGGLLMDQFLRTAKSQSKWYGLSSDNKADPIAVSSWSTESKLNNCYSRIARPSGLTFTFVFISMGNLTLARHDAYLTHVKSGIKPDTVADLRTAPLHIPTLFPDAVIKRAEEEISHYESKGHSGSSHSKARFHPYERSDRRSDKRPDKKGDKSAWKNIGKGRYRKPRGKAPSYSS